MGQPAIAALGLENEVVRDQHVFSGLAEDWNRLYDASPRTTPFQTHAWLDAWWRAYGQSGRMRIFLVRSNGRLVAAAPFFLERRGPVRVLAPLGGAVSDFVDIMVEEGTSSDETSAFLSSLIGALQVTAGWDVLDLAEVRASAAVELLAKVWPGAVHRSQASTCLELPVTDFGQLLATLPTKRAREIRRVLRRSDELDLEVSDVPPEEVDQAVSELLRLHASQWQGRGGNPEHQRARFAQHLSQALTQMVQQGQAAVALYRLDGELLAGQVVLIGHDIVGGYLLGVAPELYARMDFSTYVIRADIERALSNECTTYSMLRGGESYKDRWQPTAAPNSRLLLTRGSAPLGPAYTFAVRARTRLVALAKEHAPWVREAKRAYIRRRNDRANQHAT